MVFLVRRGPWAPLKKVLQYASNLYCSAFGATELSGKGNLVSAPPICVAVCLPFTSQYASHLYRNTFGKILVVVVTGMFPKQHQHTSESESDRMFCAGVCPQSEVQAINLFPRCEERGVVFGGKFWQNICHAKFTKFFAIKISKYQSSPKTSGTGFAAITFALICLAMALRQEIVNSSTKINFRGPEIAGVFQSKKGGGQKVRSEFAFPGFRRVMDTVGIYG